MTLIPVKKEGKMKTLALIVLIMVMGLSGCASSLKSSYIIQDWRYFLHNPIPGSLESVGQDFRYLWHNPIPGSMESVGQDFRYLWHNPVPGSLRSIGQDWRDFLRDPWM
jgi:hypothetical protein